MNDGERQRIAEVLTILADHYQRPMTPAALAFYVECVDRLPYEAVERETERELQRDVRRFGGREPYAAALRARGSSYEEKAKRARREALRRLTLDRCLQKTRQAGPVEADRGPTPWKSLSSIPKRRLNDTSTTPSGSACRPRLTWPSAPTRSKSSKGCAWR